MINSFNDVPVRDTGIIYKSVFEQIKKLHSRQPELAGELAISAIELILTGQLSTDDFTIDILLENMKEIAKKNEAKYNDKIEQKREQRRSNLLLDEIAELLNQGKTQKSIAEALGESAQIINYRVGIIRREYPELLNQKNQKNQRFDQ